MTRSAVGLLLAEGHQPLETNLQNSTMTSKAPAAVGDESMKTNKVVSVEDYKIVSSFQTLKKTLLDDKFADRLKSRWAYWAMPERSAAAAGVSWANDQRPAGYAVRRTVGYARHRSEKNQLSREATLSGNEGTPSCYPVWNDRLGRSPQSRVASRKNRAANRRLNSIPRWCPKRTGPSGARTVQRHDFGHEKLGRLAPTLQSLPTVIWHTPLEFYMNYSVAEIRQLKTHGEKRVRVVLEVFHLIHQTVCASARSEYLSVRIGARSSSSRWIRWDSASDHPGRGASARCGARRPGHSSAGPIAHRCRRYGV